MKVILLDNHNQYETEIFDKQMLLYDHIKGIFVFTIISIVIYTLARLNN